MGKAKAAALFAPTEAPPEKPAKVQPDRPAYREGKRIFSTWLNEKAARQMKMIAAEEGRTVQELMEEIINREFARRGMPEIA